MNCRQPMIILAVAGLFFSQLALSRKYSRADFEKDNGNYYEEQPYYQPELEPEEVVFYEEDDRGESIARGAAAGAIGGGLLGLAASGGKGKGFGYGALAGAGVGGLMGGLYDGSRRRYAARRPYRKNYRSRAKRRRY